MSITKIISNFSIFCYHRDDETPTCVLREDSPMKEPFDLSALLAQNKTFSLRRQLGFVCRLSVPGILAQISSIIMQYIDAAMVGSLGARASAAIGLVASSTWLLGGLCDAMSMGFAVQVAQAVGAGEKQRARAILRQAIVVCALFSLALAAAGMAVSGALPAWLGGEAAIIPDAAAYFFVFAAALPAFQLFFLLCAVMQCSGEMRVPGILNVAMCALDVAGNVLFIFGCGLGVLGAALGSALAVVIVTVAAAYFACVRSPVLSVRGKGRWLPQRQTLREAARISVPMGLEKLALCGAYVMSTKIIAPLGTVAIAAHSFSITAESLCYMPGYGIGEAATTLVGQSIGARRADLAKRFAWVTVAMGMCVMAAIGLVMYALCPAVFRFLTPDPAVQTLGVRVLRIELWAEAFYAASIVVSGALRGAGDTFVPGIMNLVSMWGVRLSLSAFLTPRLGLSGAWIAMAAELCFRGIIFLIRLKRGRWLKRREASAASLLHPDKEASEDSL